MAHVFQVGVGSGGMPVIDLLCRDERVAKVTLVEPDIYLSHNATRHPFSPSAAGALKAELAEVWLRDRRPDLDIEALTCDITEPAVQDQMNAAAQACDIGICAADNEPAKFHFDALMRTAGKAWTLGEVLSGGIGGFVHSFKPGGACYGCVSSHLRRGIAEAPAAKAPDYSQPGGPTPETAVPAGIAAIQTIAGLHALITQQLLADPHFEPGFNSLLISLAKVPGVFDEAFRTFKFKIPRSNDCLVCRPGGANVADLDAALDQALHRLK